MTLKTRLLGLGALTGMAGGTFALAAFAWLDSHVGAVVGVGICAIVGALACHGAFTLLEKRLRECLLAVELNQLGLSRQDPGHTGSPELDELLGFLRATLKTSKEGAVEWADVAVSAQAIWHAMQAKSSSPADPPEAPECVAAIIEMFRQTADALTRHSSSLEDANERMASGAVDQSETVSRTTTTVEDLSDKIDRISQNAENATEACERTRQEARRGLEQVHQVIEGMERLRSQIEVNGRKARRLGDRSVEIGTIVELIRGISSRTDMLALNATIESVRAGEHGRGFAVVAEEIRKLAERTATATRDIGTLVEAIQADTHESIRALGEEQSEMEQESHRVREAGAALERISQVAEHSASLVDGISRSTIDQVAAAQDLVRAMQRISDVSQLTLERSTQSRESIRNLGVLCERLSPLSTPELFSTRGDGNEILQAGKSAVVRRKRRLVGSERSS